MTNGFETTDTVGEGMPIPEPIAGPLLADFRKAVAQEAARRLKMTSKFARLDAEQTRILKQRSEEIREVDRQCMLQDGLKFLARIVSSEDWNEDTQEIIRSKPRIYIGADATLLDELDKIHAWAHEMLDDDTNQ